MRLAILSFTFLLLLTSCSSKDDKYGPYTFMSGCNGGVFLCDKWFGSYLAYKVWLQNYPLRKDIENGVWVDQNQNLIRDDIDYFIDEIITKEYKFLDDMISLLKQYARIHGQYSRMEFSEERANFLLHNEFKGYINCRLAFLDYKNFYGAYSGAIYQLTHILLTHEKSPSFLTYLQYLRTNQDQVNYTQGILEPILTMPKHCSFEVKDGLTIFNEFSRKRKSSLKLLEWNKTIQSLEKKYGTSYREFYEKFNEK